MSFLDNNGLQIMVTFSNGLLFDMGNLLSFYFINTINIKPSGYFRMADYGSKNIQVNNGDFATVLFSNTTDNPSTAKASGFSILIDEITAEKTDGPNTMYLIKFSVCNKEQLVKKTVAYKGNSVDSIRKIFDEYAVKYSIAPDTTSKCADKMTWRVISDNMWEQLDTITEKSFIPNDYLYWCWDDVNNIMKVSSFNTERSVDEYQLCLPSNDNIGTTGDSTTLLQKSNLVLYKYLGDKRYNDLAKNRDKLFPSVAFSGVRDGKMQECLVKGSCFEDTLASMGDNSRKDVLAASGLTDGKVAYGNLKIIRNWPNNVHNMYSVAPIFRDYKLATYAKKMNLQLHNTVGPVLGSKIGTIAMGLGYKTSGVIEYDNTYSDSYLVYSKVISYESSTTDRYGRKVNGSNPVCSTLTLISDNLKTSEEYIQSTLKKLGMK